MVDAAATAGREESKTEATWHVWHLSHCLSGSKEKETVLFKTFQASECAEDGELSASLAVCH